MGDTLEREMKPVGDLHSVPHFRCPNCRGAVLVFRMDKRRKRCRWCGQKLKWSIWQRGWNLVLFGLRCTVWKGGKCFDGGERTKRE